jgi:hypothetical protein
MSYNRGSKYGHGRGRSYGGGVLVEASIEALLVQNQSKYVRNMK